MQTLADFIYQFIFLAAPSVIAGVSAALFSVNYAERREKKAMAKALRDKLASEISLFDASCRILVGGAAKGKHSMQAVRDLALHTALIIMDTFRFQPEAKAELPWGELMAFAHGLILLAVKGWEQPDGADWFIKTTKDLADQAVIFMKYSD
ncbi:MAG: hypothetical protein ACTSW4_00875 [Candidatus Ranarchaeia archaeon]